MALAFLVPGFVYTTTVSLVLSSRYRDNERPWLQYLSVSAFLWIVSGPVLLWAHSMPKSWQYASLVFVTFLWPVASGMAFSHLQSSGKLRGWLVQLGFNPIHFRATAWEYKLRSVREYTWVLVTLTDGNQTLGKFGATSLASSDPAERDLYLEEVWRIPPGEKEWEPAPRTDGIWIRGDAIKTIEFYSVE